MAGGLGGRARGTLSVARRCALVLALACAACSPKRVGFPEGAKARARERIDALRARGAEADARRTRALAGAARLGPRPDLGACPLAITVPTESGAPTLTSLTMDGLGVRTQLLPRDAGEPGPTWQRLARELDVIEADVRADRGENYGDDPAAGLETRVRALADPASWDYDFALLVESGVAARAGATSFTGGRLRGRLLVWSYRDGAFVCAGRAIAACSSEVKVHDNDGVQNELEARMVVAMDLERQALRAGLKSLARAGEIREAPPVPGAPLVGAVTAKPERCACTLADRKAPARVLFSGDEHPLMNLRGRDVELVEVQRSTIVPDHKPATMTDRYGAGDADVKIEWFVDEPCAAGASPCAFRASAIVTVEQNGERQLLPAVGGCGCR
jgi:hypothetical protein